MKKWGHATSAFLIPALFVITFFIFPHSSYSIIFNEGNQATEIQVTKENGETERVIIYPGQSTETPPDATQIQVVRRQFSRGDEIFRIRVEEENGTTRYMTKSGESVTLGTPVEEIVTANAYGTALNECNFPVYFVVTYKDGHSETFRIMPTHTLRFSSDAEKVRVLSGSITPLRGDETVKVSITTPTNEVLQVNSIEATVRVDGAGT